MNELATGTGERITGIVLCGGASTRMHRDKLALTVRGATLLERAVHTIGQACDRIVLACDNARRPAIAAVLASDNRCSALEDTVSHRGPAVAFAHAVAAIDTDRVVLVPADMPLLGPDVVDLLLATCVQSVHGVMIHAPNDQLHPQVSAWKRAALAPLTRRIATRGRGRLHQLAEISNTRMLTEHDLAMAGIDPLRLVNVNTPDDLQRARDLASQTGPSM